MHSTLRFVWALCALSALTSCKKSQSIVPENDTLPGASISQPGNDAKPDRSKAIRLLAPDKNGKLVIDGNTESYSCDTTLSIKGGLYNAIEVKNLQGKPGCPIRIQNDGLVEIVVGYQKMLSISNVSHVLISGDGTTSISKGFLFRDNHNQRAVELKGAVNHFTLQHVAFKNLGHYAINYNGDQVYDGNEQSCLSNLVFSHLKAENCNALIRFGGGITNGVIKGLIRGLEISHLDVSNCPKPKNAVSVGMVQDYDVHDNTFSHINTENNEHNSMFFLVGNGKFYNNRINNHQGNALRAWVVSVGDTPKSVEIFNNIVVESRKYSAFETQSFERFMIPKKTTYANVKVYHNTCGSLNLSRDWYGVVLDAYNLFGGRCEVFNNLAFNLPAPHPESKFISYMSVDVSTLYEDNNLYFSDAKAAGIVDEQSYKLSTTSKVVSSGKKNGLNFDIYGNPRDPNTPTIGAVE